MHTYTLMHTYTGSCAAMDPPTCLHANMYIIHTSIHSTHIHTNTLVHTYIGCCAAMDSQHTHMHEKLSNIPHIHMNCESTSKNTNQIPNKKKKVKCVTLLIRMYGSSTHIQRTHVKHTTHSRHTFEWATSHISFIFIFFECVTLRIRPYGSSTHLSAKDTCQTYRTFPPYLRMSNDTHFAFLFGM